MTTRKKRIGKPNKHERQRGRNGNNRNNNNNNNDGSGFFSGFSHFYVLFSASTSCLSKDSLFFFLLFCLTILSPIFGCFLKSNALFSNQFNAISAYTHTHTHIPSYGPIGLRQPNEENEKIPKIIVITIRTLIILCALCVSVCACVGRFVHTIQCHSNCEFGWLFFIQRKNEKRKFARYIFVHGKKLQKRYTTQSHILYGTNFIRKWIVDPEKLTDLH